jgi:hypothetical protein
LSTNNDILKKNMLEALEKSLGVVTTACKSVGISRNTHYTWLKDDAEDRAFVDGLIDVALDFAESRLHKKIADGDTTAVIFYLKTKGKKRGYVERQEIDHSGTVGVTLIEGETDPNDEPIKD